MTSDPESPPDPSVHARLRRVATRHPIIVGVLVGATVVGAILGVVLFPDSWTLARRILGGALGGAGCGLICTAPRIIG